MKSVNTKEIALRVFDLLKNKGKFKKDLAAYLGVKPSTVSNWGSGAADSIKGYVPEISIFLDVSTDYLFFGVQPDSNNLSNEEYQILTAYRKANNQAKKIVNTTLEPFGLFFAQEKAT